MNLHVKAPSFLLSSHECELLIAFEASGGIQELAVQKNRDLSVVSRQIKKISEMAAVLEKSQGKWRLTELGREVCAWTRKVALEQANLLKNQRILRLATTPEFCVQMLAPQLLKLKRSLGVSRLDPITETMNGAESALLSGNVDLAIECGRPHSPLIRFRLIKKEPLVIVLSEKLAQQLKGIKGDVAIITALAQLPAIQFNRLPLSHRLKLTKPIQNLTAEFDSIAAARSACQAGLGWTLLPKYAVKNYAGLHALTLELEHGECFGVWWLREHRGIESLAKKMITWLEQQNLD